MTTTPDPTSAFKPAMNRGEIVMTVDSAYYVADLMLRYGSVEARIQPKNGQTRSAFFASRQHSVYTDGAETLFRTRLPSDHPYTFYNFALMYGEGRFYQLSTDTVPTLLEPWLSVEEVGEWTAFLSRVNNAINALLRNRNYAADATEAPADGRIRLRLRQREEA